MDLLLFGTTSQRQLSLSLALDHLDVGGAWPLACLDIAQPCFDSLVNQQRVVLKSGHKHLGERPNITRQLNLLLFLVDHMIVVFLFILLRRALRNDILGQVDRVGFG